MGTTRLLPHISQELAPCRSHENCGERHLVGAHISTT
ncbi:mCG1049121 [Mus musculus]|nr:mCG1049121 [Mus musculus]